MHQLQKRSHMAPMIELQRVSALLRGVEAGQRPLACHIDRIPTQAASSGTTVPLLQRVMQVCRVVRHIRGRPTAFIRSPSRPPEMSSDPPSPSSPITCEDNPASPTPEEELYDLVTDSDRDHSYHPICSDVSSD